MGANHRNARRLQRHRRLRAHERGHRPLRRRSRRERGGHRGPAPTTEDGLGSFPEAYGNEVCSFDSRSRVDWSDRNRFASGVCDATSPPRALLSSDPDKYPGRTKHQRTTQVCTGRPLADPQSVTRAIDLLLSARRTLIAAGDGIFWSGAAPELLEFIELANIPVYTRRAGQGAVAEDHPLVVRGSWKKPFTGRADAVLAIGFRFWSGEKFGAAPTWNERDRYISKHHSDADGLHAAEVALTGDAKLILHLRRSSCQRLEAVGRTGSKKSPTCGPTSTRRCGTRARAS